MAVTMWCPDPEIVRRLLRYDPDTGSLFWMVRDDVKPNWNGRYAGTRAFTSIDRKGYHKGAIFNHTYRAHRVAWAIHYGEWPVNQIDHINGVRTDNRMSNLRQATNAENGRNKGPQKNNKSGFKGVFWDSRKGKWAASLRINGKHFHGGFFLEAKDAAKSYSHLAAIHHGHFAHTQGE